MGQQLVFKTHVSAPKLTVVPKKCVLPCFFFPQHCAQAEPRQSVQLPIPATSTPTIHHSTLAISTTSKSQPKRARLLERPHASNMIPSQTIASRPPLQALLDILSRTEQHACILVHTIQRDSLAGSMVEAATSLRSWIVCADGDLNFFIRW